LSFKSLLDAIEENDHHSFRQAKLYKILATEVADALRIIKTLFLQSVGILQKVEPWKFAMEFLKYAKEKEGLGITFVIRAGG
jgi:hypothetical protein